MSRFYITTPIYYINAEPHLGHAYTSMVADAVARAHRLSGDEVFFLTGTDEHGQKVERAAKKSGLAVKAFADQTAQRFRDILPALGITNDDFIRTSEPRHYAAAQALWRAVNDRGFIYKSKYEGWYCTVDEVFVPETQLVDGRCPTCGSAVEKIEEESYFFKLSAFQQPLIDHYRQHPEFLVPAMRRNEMLSFLEGGLDDLSISRTSLKWGIPVPDDPAHVMYVWFDALTNYMTAVGYGDTTPSAEARFKKFWPVDVHLIGKEIVRQHAVYWPAFLMAAGLPLPKQIVSHGWWLMDGAKMSKSKGNVARPHEYVERFGLDALRYFVFREMILGQDANFGDDAILTRYNADLANDLGNLVSRATTMIHRYCEGRVPSPDAALMAREPEQALIAAARETIDRARRATLAFDLSAALRDVWELVGATNRYIVTREPWKLAKSGSPEDLATTLYVAADTVRVIADLLRPYMPGTAVKTLTMLGVPADPQAWTSLAPGALKSGSHLGETTPLFPRIEQSVEELRAMSTGESPESPVAGQKSQVETESKVPVSSPAPAAAGPSAQNPAPSVQNPATGLDGVISIDDFMKVELCVAKVLTAERVPKSKKLLKLSVDTGSDQRTIVAGIAEAYEPEALVGRTIAIVFNLKPATLMGIQSNGMVLAATNAEGKPQLVSFDAPAPAPGSRVR